MKLKYKLVLPLVLLFFSLYINIGLGQFLKDSFEETKVVNNEFWEFNLGSSTGTFELDINITSERNIDILFMDYENYLDYYFGDNFTFFEGASKLNTTSMHSIYTTTPQIAYFLIIDNTNNVPNGASYIGPSNVTVKVISTRVDGNFPLITGYPSMILILIIGVVFIIIYKKENKTGKFTN